MPAHDPTETIRWLSLGPHEQKDLEKRISTLAKNVERAEPHEQSLLRQAFVELAQEYNRYRLEDVNYDILVRGANACIKLGEPTYHQASSFAQRALLKAPFKIILRETLYAIRQLDEIAHLIQFPTDNEPKHETAEDAEIKNRKNMLFEILASDREREAQNRTIIKGFLTHNDYSGKKQEVHYKLANDYFTSRINLAPDPLARAIDLKKWADHLTIALTVLNDKNLIPGIIDQYPLPDALHNLTLPKSSIRNPDFEAQFKKLILHTLEQAAVYTQKHPATPATQKAVLEAFTIRTRPLIGQELAELESNRPQATKSPDDPISLDTRIALIGTAYQLSKHTDPDLAYLYAEALYFDPARSKEPGRSSLLAIADLAYYEWTTLMRTLLPNEPIQLIRPLGRYVNIPDPSSPFDWNRTQPLQPALTNENAPRVYPPPVDETLRDEIRRVARKK